MRIGSLGALLAAFGLWGCTQGSDWKPARPGEIFRYTAIGRGTSLDSIVLGQQWKTAAKYGAGDDTLFALPNRYVGGTDGIVVHRDSSGVVTSLEFAYNTGRDTKALIADYEKSLGTPAVTIDTVAATVRTTARWQDDSTAFVLLTMVPPDKNGIAAFAVLSDRRLSGR